MYQVRNPSFSIDQQGHCAYEKYSSAAYNCITSPIHELPPPYAKQFEQELFDIYFTYVHPFYPILDRFYVSRALQYDSDVLPTAFKWAVMAVALHFTQRQDSTAAAYYFHASIQLDHTPSLLSLQTLFLLYKYQELITHVGCPLPNDAVDYLKEAQVMIQQLKQQRSNLSIWTINDEFLNRASWILYIIVSMSSTADKRWKAMFEGCTVPTRFPSLTESEQYDKGELNTTCNLIHLINISLLYSQTLCLISDQSTLFVSADHSEFTKLATNLEICKSKLPSHIALSLTADPPILYSAQNHAVSHDSSKTASFTAYICLIYDILDLLICIHQCCSSSIPSDIAHIPKKASQIYYRSHSFTVGDLQEPRFSRMASIQGSRLVSFGLTLALQAYSYYHEQKHTKTLEDIKRYYGCCTLLFRIFDDMALSSQLYITIQTLRAQIEAKEQVDTSESIDSSGNSSKTTTPHEDQQTRIDYSFPRISPQNSASYFYAHIHDNSANEQYTSQEENGHQQWQDYDSYPNYQPENHWSQHGSQYYQQQKYDHDNIPLTPTFVQEFGRSPSSLEHDPLTPLSLVDMDSYFHPIPSPNHPQPIRTVPIAISVTTAGSSGFINHFPSSFQNSKSCKYNKII
jgi:hypothetical protein